jgi:hypothetical protein
VALDAENGEEVWMRTFTLLAAAIVFLPLSACDLKNAERTAPEGYTLVLTADPDVLPADGQSMSEIAALVCGPDGVVEDGTIVHFVASLGTIQPQCETHQGLARVSFVAGTAVGTAEITASCGSAAASVEVRLGSKPSRVVLFADPPYFLAEDGDWHWYESTLVATVWDADGQPAADEPVMFMTDRGEMESKGAILRTDSQGQVSDRLWVKLTLEQGDLLVINVQAVCGDYDALAMVTVERKSDPEEGN